MNPHRATSGSRQRRHRHHRHLRRDTEDRRGETGARAPRRARPPRTATKLPRRRLALIDAVDEVLAGVLARPARAILTTLGTVIGLASLVATLGISGTAGNQIVERFDELGATQVVVRAAEQRQGRGDAAASSIPWDVETRLDPLNGVVASGAIVEVSSPGLVRTVPVTDPTAPSGETVPVFAASTGVLDAVRGHISAGRWFDSGHVERADPVVVIGADVAENLAITDLARGPGIFVGDHFYAVIGILDAAERDGGLVGSIIMPSSVAQRDYDVGQPTRVVVDVDLGAAELVASQAPTALSPGTPDSVRASAPPSPTASRDDVEGDVNSLFLLLGLISLVVGAIGIANVTLVTVMERTGEIGLRRALGAKRRHIAGQFLGESALMGFIGGIVGSSVGTVAVVAVSASREWTPVLDMRLALAAPVAGALVGLLAGCYPAVRAARMEPVEALRAGL